MEQAGYLIAGLAGRGAPGFLFIPWKEMGIQEPISPYALGSAYGVRGYWIARSGAEFFDQPVRFVRHMEPEVLEGAEEVTISEVTFRDPGFFKPHVRILAQFDELERSAVVVTAQEAPDDLPGVEPGTILEVCDDFGTADLRPWAMRAS